MVMCPLSTEAGEWSDIEKRILREALRLGFEVGLRGHIEGVGWVRSKLRDLEAEATRFGLNEDLKAKYEAGKEFGKRKRLSAFTSSSEGGLFFSRKGGPKLPKPPKSMPVRVVNEDNSIDYIVERVPFEEGIDALATLMKIGHKNRKFMKKLDVMLSSLGDVHDRLTALPQIPEDKRRTFESGLGILIEVGWIREYEVVEFDDKAMTIKIDAISEIARSIGESPDPMCRPICVAIESIANRAFGISMKAVEKFCIAQKKSNCRFAIIPRPNV